MKQRYCPIPKLTTADTERFWSKVDRRGSDECWSWIASRQDGGRGMIRLAGRLYKAPRVAYTLAVGSDPGQRDVCHTCDNPACCNPNHLWLGTRAENNDDRDGKGHQIAFRGERHPNAILTEPQVRSVLKSELDGRYLASRLGVSESAISAIRHRRLWKHVHA